MPLTPRQEAFLTNLRSGEYPQTFGLLRRLYPVGEEVEEAHRPAGYCCLGVLCETYRQLTGRGEWGLSGTFEMPDGGYYDTAPPEEVAKFFGLRASVPVLSHDDNGCMVTAIDLNDSQQQPFGAIADFFEEHFLKLNGANGDSDPGSATVPQ